ncbi:hypothetical protein Dimus_027742 [Dionaea muscipula]
MGPWESWVRSAVMILVSFFGLHFALLFVSADGKRSSDLAIAAGIENQEVELSLVNEIVNFLWEKGQQAYTHVWPEMTFGWKIVVGTVIGFLGAAFGSVGGVGGGGIFVPMLNLIVGFDAKSSTAMSKCMIMGAAGATVYYNLSQKHPTLDLPIIDYDLVLLLQPMLVLGISIGVVFNVIFADWMVTILLIVLFLGTSIKAFLKGVETWKSETIIKMEAAARRLGSGRDVVEVEYKPLPGDPNKKSKVSVIENVQWKELGILSAVWVAILALEISKHHTATCSVAYWMLNLLEIPVAVGASSYQAIMLYKGKRVLASRGEAGENLKVHQLVLYCALGLLAGVVGGLLGLGGGFILGPLFLELGIPPQVSSATATFAMTFSSSMSVIEYYLLKRFPVPYAVYFAVVATVAALIGQHVVRKLISLLGRASLIIFILAFTIFVSAISLGGVGISNMVYKIKHKEYMGFENLCTHHT